MNQSAEVPRVIRGLIGETGVTRGAVAQAMRVNRETLRRRLNGSSPFTVAELEAVAMLLGTTPQAIFARADKVAV